MSTATVELDLWPDDVRIPEKVVSPYQLLHEQARRLEEHTHGLVRASVARIEADDRTGIRFELQGRNTGFRCTLFEVAHRRELAYPCVIVPPSPFPEFLRAEVYQPGVDDMVSALGLATSPVRIPPGKWIENRWLASSQQEFIEKIRAVLHSPEARSTIASMIAREQDAAACDEGRAGDDPSGPDDAARAIT